LELLAHRAVFDCSLPRGDVRWVAAVIVGAAGTESVVPSSPPAHSSPLGLVLAALAQFCFEIGGANIENPPRSFRRSQLCGETTRRSRRPATPD
jgi:hypothetical protein